MPFTVSPTRFRSRSTGPGIGCACGLLLSLMGLPVVAGETRVVIDRTQWTINGATRSSTLA